uniref:Leucine-rich repeat-containing N-terminal plant-type domain-containing protein n=1 Tax=Quercus lobata TaxID=97700 RepID=A0A7N2M7X1_QUELO
MNLKSALQTSNTNVFSSWESGNSICNFTGISCTSDDSITEIELSYQNLTGVLPLDSVCQLQSLEKLSFGFNYLHGPIMDDLKNFVKLQYLDLGNNLFTGWSVPEISSLNQLRYLHLNASGFSGTFPWKSLQNMTGLVWLSLGDNPFNPSPFPNEVLLLTNLTWLHLSNCGIQGTIPAEIGNLKELINLELSVPAEFGNFTKLVDLSLYRNNFTGPLPHNLLSWAKTNFIDVSLNFFTGPIPPDMCKQGTLRGLLLLQNNLTGEIPASYANCSTLLRFRVNNNSLSGKVPIGIWGLPKVNIIDISLNDIEGPITSDIKNAKSLTYLFAGKNRLSAELPAAICNGTIPDTFAKGSKLRTIVFNDNNLKGLLPKSFINCTNLEVLDLGDNKINDLFPYWSEALTNLQVLVLKSNKFHGPIGNHKTSGVFFFKLRILDLSHNEFTGFLPRNYFENFNAMMMINDEGRLEPHYLGESSRYQDSVVVTVKGLEINLQRILTIFTTIDLSSNKFEGVIPEELGKLTVLRLLNLSHNSLTGHIPSSLAKLSALESLDLSSNSLIGEIPLQLTDLTFLAMLNLSQNQLIGPIPQGKQFATFENNSYDRNLGLCGFPLSCKCGTNELTQPAPPSTFQEDNDSLFASGFGWKAVLIGYGCGLLFGLAMGYVVFKIRKPKWLVRFIEGKQKDKKRRPNNQRPGQRRN